MAPWEPASARKSLQNTFCWNGLLAPAALLRQASLSCLQVLGCAQKMRILEKSRVRSEVVEGIASGLEVSAQHGLDHLGGTSSSRSGVLVCRWRLALAKVNLQCFRGDEGSDMLGGNGLASRSAESAGHLLAISGVGGGGWRVRMLQRGFFAMRSKGEGAATGARERGYGQKDRLCQFECGKWFQLHLKQSQGKRRPGVDASRRRSASS